MSNIAEIANSTFVWSQGKLKVVPLGDAELSANGKTWKPDLTPIYDLSEDDFIADDEPVVCTRTQQADVYNSVKLEYLNRANDYNLEVVEAQDLADIELHGLRPADTLKAHEICTDEVAQRTVQLALERMLAARNKYKFKLPLKFILLEPADIVTITYKKLGLERELVRIKSISEDDGQLQLEVEELVVGAATPAKIAHQRAEGTKLTILKGSEISTPLLYLNRLLNLLKKHLKYGSEFLLPKIFSAVLKCGFQTTAKHTEKKAN